MPDTQTILFQFCVFYTCHEIQKKLLDLDYTQLSKYSNRKLFIYTYRSYMKYTKKISLFFSVSALVLKQRIDNIKRKLYENRDHTYRTVE